MNHPVIKYFNEAQLSMPPTLEARLEWYFAAGPNSLHAHLPVPSPIMLMKVGERLSRCPTAMLEVRSVSLIFSHFPLTITQRSPVGMHQCLQSSSMEKRRWERMQRTHLTLMQEPLLSGTFESWGDKNTLQEIWTLLYST